MTVSWSCIQNITAKTKVKEFFPLCFLLEALQFHSFVCGYPIFPAPFVEDIILSTLLFLASLSKISWLFRYISELFIPLIYIFFVVVWYYFNYYSFVMFCGLHAFSRGYSSMNTLYSLMYIHIISSSRSSLTSLLLGGYFSFLWILMAHHLYIHYCIYGIFYYILWLLVCIANPSQSIL